MRNTTPCRRFRRTVCPQTRNPKARAKKSKPSQRRNVSAEVGTAKKIAAIKPNPKLELPDVTTYGILRVEERGNLRMPSHARPFSRDDHSASVQQQPMRHAAWQIIQVMGHDQ